MKSFNRAATVIQARPSFLTGPVDEDALPPMPRARGTREWVKADHALGTSWFLELAYRLGRAHRDIRDLKKPPSKVYG